MGALQSFTSVLPTLTGTLGAVQTIAGTVGAVQALANPDRDEDLALQQLQDRQALQSQQQSEHAALERDRITLNAAQTEEERQRALRRAVARQRANFGASGVSSAGGGSSDAVLLGLFEESEEERQQREANDVLRLQALDQDLSQRQAINLLQATQLAERQSLNDLF